MESGGLGAGKLGTEPRDIELPFPMHNARDIGRDMARVPVAWNGKDRFGGFSAEAEKAGIDIKEPWMKPHPLAREINVAAQLEDPDSGRLVPILTTYGGKSCAGTLALFESRLYWSTAYQS
jgi:hypothetical protein